jgi:diadenylate cyclase
VTGALGGFQWRDAVDILVVALVIYRVLVMFKGTRAVQMAVGLSALVATSLIAQWLDLQSVLWLVGHFWAFWVIALVVLFQPELRRALARFGQGRAFQTLLGPTREEHVHVIDEIVSAVESLSARRVGALIVLERGTGLRQYAELGVPLDALVSADLLSSVFLPYSPLHDGAVFVRGRRVVAAGGFLPLSRNMQIGRALGTRHRAALGVTEETDAVAVVVSEETGAISVAVEGQIDRVADADALRQDLRRLLGVAEEPEVVTAVRRRMRRLLPRVPGRA